MNEIWILLFKLSILQMFLFLFYHLFLRKLTFFKLNRLYLLLALFLPFLAAIPYQISHSVLETTGLRIPLPEWQETLMQGEQVVKATTSLHIDFWLAATLLYTVFVLLLLTRFTLGCITLVRMIRSSSVTRRGSLWFVMNDNYTAPFSFFRYIFLRKQEAMDSPVIRHEEAHARQWHTLDLMLAELICALFWFNPFVFFHKKAIRANHEFLADNKVLQSGFLIEEYLDTFTSMLYTCQVPGFASHFNKGLTKKRIHMIVKNRSERMAYLKYILLLPLILILLVGFSHPRQMIPPLVVQNQEIKQSEPGIPSIAPYKIDDKQSITMVNAYGMRKHPINHQMKFHQGIDFAMLEGKQVIATASGVVSDQKLDNAFGLNVILLNGQEYKTVYAHLSKVLVKAGDHVKQGQAIGEVGSTGISVGSHIHYEVWKDNKTLDPLKFIPKEDVPRFGEQK